MLINNPPLEIAENIWMLGTAQYPVFLLKGRTQGAIVEGGIGPVGPIVLGQLDAMGVARDYVRQLVVTHAHPDHVMAVPLWRDSFPEIAVIASKAGAKTMAAEKAISLFCRLDDALAAGLAERGMIPGDCRRPDLAEMAIAVDRVVGHGDRVSVDGIELDVLATPGHSDCSLSFHDPATGTLFVSDATGYYLPEADYWWPNYFVDYGVYLDSMCRLSTVGARVLCLAHNTSVRDTDAVADYFDRAIAATEEYHGRIVDEITGGKTIRQLAEQLGSEVYEKAPLFPLDFFQKNSGMLVKISLKHEGIEAR